MKSTSNPVSFLFLVLFALIDCSYIFSEDAILFQKEHIAKKTGNYFVETLNKTADSSMSLETTTTASVNSIEHPPAPIPVISEEEAKRINTFAIFLSTVPKTVVEGEILERSELPDPRKSDYPDCRFTVHFNGNCIKSGKSCPKELILVVNGFENYRILPNNTLKKGDKVQCAIFPFDLLPDDFQSTQQVDDLDLFLLERYYVLDIVKIDNYSDNELIPASGIFFSDENADYISIFERQINPPISQSLIDAQKCSIQDDLRRMSNLLAEYDDKKIRTINETFSIVWEAEKRKDLPNRNRVRGVVWRSKNNSFWALPESYTLLSKHSLLTPNTLRTYP